MITERNYADLATPCKSRGFRQLNQIVPNLEQTLTRHSTCTAHNMLAVGKKEKLSYSSDKGHKQLMSISEPKIES